MTTRKVLVTLDITEQSEQILPVLRRLFEPETTELTLLSVIPSAATYVGTSAEMMAMSSPAYGSATYTAADDYQQWEQYGRSVEEHLQGVATRLKQAGFAVSTVTRIGEPATEIIEATSEADYALLAMSTHGRKGLSRLMLGSVAEQVLRLSPIPVLLTGPSAAQDETVPAEALSQSLKQEKLALVAATDGSSHGREAIGLASRFALRLDTALKIVIAVDEQESAAYRQKLMNEARTWTESARAELIPSVGYTEDVIDRYLDENPVDLLVIGAFRDRGTGAGASIGLTAQRIVQYAPTSVLMVKGVRPTAGNILACIAPDNDVVIDVVAQLASALGSHLHLLHVIPPKAGGPTSVQPVSLDAALAANDERAGFLRNTVAKMDALGLDRSLLTLRSGPVVDAIMQTGAEGHYDVLAVGSQSGPGYFLGSVSDAVLRRADHSVLIVRTKP